jgi:hypothetical protein
MAADVASRGRIEGDIYTFLDIVVLVDMVVDDDGLSKRRVSQVGMFFNENGEKKLLRIFDNGQLVCPNLPIQTLARFEKAKIDNPFINDDIVAQCNGLDLSSLEPLMNISSHVDPALLRAHAAQQAAIAQQNTIAQQAAMNPMMQNIAMQGQAQYQAQAAQHESVKALSSKISEKRKTKRYDVDGEIMVKIGDYSFERVIVKNVSAGGIGILSKQPLNQNPSNFMMLASFELTGLEKPIMLELKAVRSVNADDGVYYGCRITRTGSGWQEYINRVSNMKS